MQINLYAAVLILVVVVVVVVVYFKAIKIQDIDF